MTDTEKQYAEIKAKAKEMLDNMPEGKKKAIAEISIQQLDLTIQAANQAIKYAKSLIKMPRIAKRKKYKGNPLAIVGTAIHIRQLEMQKRIIASQPIPKFPQGGLIAPNGRETFNHD